MDIAPMYVENLEQHPFGVRDPIGFHDLTVIVQQRVDVDTTPLTLTLPLEARKPPKP